MRDFESLTKHFNEPIDARYITLQFYFYDLTYEQIDELTRQYVELVDELTKDTHFIHWTFRNYKPHHVKRKDVLKNIQKGIYDYPFYNSAYFEGFVSNDLVYNVTTMKNIQRLSTSLYRDWLRLTGWGNSIDHTDFVLEKFPNISRENLQDVVYDIFYERNKKNIDCFYLHDVEGGLYYHGITNGKKNGEIILRFLYFALGDHVKEYSEKMRAFLKRISEQFVNISGYVMLTPLYSKPQNQSLFRSLSKKQQRTLFSFGDYENISPIDPSWNGRYYSYGADWYNIVSPLQQRHIPNLLEESKQYSNVFCNQLRLGGIELGVIKDISETDVMDLLPIRTLLYNALIPGQDKIPFEHIRWSFEHGREICIRQDWRYVPIFKDEIIVDEDFLIFRHRNYIEDDIT